MKSHEVRGTPFYLWWGGGQVDGQCKWVVDSDDDYILQDFLLDWDQLYCDKYEAIERCEEWWAKNQNDYA
jgi:hypothetical protein